jgi:hypothetical protein
MLAASCTVPARDVGAAILALRGRVHAASVTRAPLAE